jgi:hypothetical protein
VVGVREEEGPSGEEAVLVPNHVWNVLFVHGHGFWTSVENALVGPIIAVLSWVCSIGNVPLAAALWSGGISFGGVISFVFADLVAMPLILIYRKFYGTKLTLRLVGLFYVLMATAGPWNSRNMPSVARRPVLVLQSRLRAVVRRQPNHVQKARGEPVTEESNPPMTLRQQARILGQLDKMVKKQQMTEDEASRLRAASAPAEFESVIREIRARHAGAKMDAAIKDGTMTQQEADDILLSIKNGEHSRSLRSHLRQLVPGRRSGGA